MIYDGKKKPSQATDIVRRAKKRKILTRKDGPKANQRQTHVVSCISHIGFLEPRKRTQIRVRRHGLFSLERIESYYEYIKRP